MRRLALFTAALALALAGTADAHGRHLAHHARAHHAYRAAREPEVVEEVVLGEAETQELQPGEAERLLAEAVATPDPTAAEEAAAHVTYTDEATSG